MNGEKSSNNDEHKVVAVDGAGQSKNILTILQSNLNGSTQLHLAWDLCECIAARLCECAHFFFLSSVPVQHSIHLPSIPWIQFLFIFHLVDASISLRHNIFNSCVFFTTVYNIDLAAFSPPNPFVVMHFVYFFFFFTFIWFATLATLLAAFRCNISLAHSIAERMRWRITFSFKLFHFNMISLFPKRIIYLYILKEEECAHTHKKIEHIPLAQSQSIDGNCV